jgi:uncharacterized protein (TIGR02266 family)
MADRKEKRRDPRVPLVLRVEYAGHAIRDVTENLSAGGLFIRTERALAPGARVPLRVGFPGLLPPLEVEVEVVRQRREGPGGPAGLAVRIPVDRTDERHKLARLAETARSAFGSSRRAYRVLVLESGLGALSRHDAALGALRRRAGVALVVEHAASGDDALRRLRDPPRIDLVLAALPAPPGDGLALVKRMRAEPALARTSLIVLGSATARARALELGVDVYLEEPARLGDILATVRTLLRLEA